MQLPYLDFTPTLASPARVEATAAVVGRTRAGAELTMRGYATLRADGESIDVGRNGWFSERSTVHIVDATLGTRIGDDITVGRFGIVHACTVGDGVVVADGACVLDASVVGSCALIAPDSLVSPRKRLAGGFIYAGNPAQPVREITREELAAAARAIRAGVAHPLVTSSNLPPLAIAPFLPADGVAGTLQPLHGNAPRIARAFVAPNSLVAGQVELADDAGIYFACVVTAGDGRIAIGPRTNIQDNSFLVTDRSRGELVIGADITIGHNVRMGSGVVEDEALVGIGAIVGDGVVVERSGCIAAGAWVEPGTVVRSGWIWAGRPAREFRPLKAAELEVFARGAEVYVRYTRAYRGG